MGDEFSDINDYLRGLNKEIARHTYDAVSRVLNGETVDNILISPEDVMSRNQSLYETIAKRARGMLESYYGVRGTKCSNRKAMAYAMLMYGACYIITPDYISSNGDVMRTRKYMATISPSLLEMLFKSDLLEKNENDISIGARVTSIIDRLSNGKKIIETMKSPLDEISIVRLAVVSEYNNGLTEKYVPVYARDTVNLNNSIVFPVDAYYSCTGIIEKTLRSNIFYIETSNERYFTTKSIAIMRKYYNNAEDIMKRCGNIYGTMVVPSFGSSKFTRCTRRLDIEYVDYMRVVTKEEVKESNNTHLGRTTLCTAYINKNTLGYKDELLKSEYSTVNPKYKHIIDGFDDTDAYRYLTLRSKSTKTEEDNTQEFVEVEKPKYKEELFQLLRSGIYFIEIMTNNGVSTHIVTSNTNILSKIYGDDYRIKYFSHDGCIKSAIYKIKSLIESPELAMKFIDEEMTRNYGVINPLEGTKYTPELVIEALTKYVNLKDTTDSEKIATYSVREKGNGIGVYFTLSKLISIKKLK